jgi:hypothetical protein
VNSPGENLEHNQINVQCANNTNMQSVATIELQIPALLPELKKATVFKEMSKPLFSIPVVCDGGMEVTFRKKDVIVTNKQKQMVLKGIRDPEKPPFGSSQLTNKSLQK